MLTVCWDLEFLYRLKVLPRKICISMNILELVPEVSKIANFGQRIFYWILVRIFVETLDILVKIPDSRYKLDLKHSIKYGLVFSQKYILFLLKCCI